MSTRCVPSLWILNLALFINYCRCGGAAFFIFEAERTLFKALLDVDAVFWTNGEAGVRGEGGYK